MPIQLDGSLCASACNRHITIAIYIPDNPWCTNQENCQYRGLSTFVPLEISAKKPLGLAGLKSTKLSKFLTINLRWMGKPPKLIINTLYSVIKIADGDQSCSHKNCFRFGEAGTLAKHRCSALCVSTSLQNCQ